MQTSRRFICISVTVTCFVLFLLPLHSFSDDHDHHKSDKESHDTNLHHDDDHDGDEGKHLTPVNNETYEEECGACHFAYQPGLLPSGSWEKILSNLPAHFDEEEVELDEASKGVIAEYLKANSAEHTMAKRAVKILKGLKGQTPLRITDTPYIRKKHDEIDPSIFSRETIGSRSNCPACHVSADKGNYEDDFVKIPR